MEEKNQREDQIDHLLGAIQRVDAPEFLETRIYARLNPLQDTIPIWWGWGSTALIAVLLMVNVWAIQLEESTSQSADVLVEEMHLVDDYNLYNN